MHVGLSTALPGTEDILVGRSDVLPTEIGCPHLGEQCVMPPLDVAARLIAIQRSCPELDVQVSCSMFAEVN